MPRRNWWIALALTMWLAALLALLVSMGDGTVCSDVYPC